MESVGRQQSCQLMTVTDWLMVGCI